MFVVWAPVLRADNKAAAKKLALEFGSDARVRQFWDQDKDVGLDLTDKIDVGKSPFAWDAYLLFAKGAKWGSKPTTWAHQLGGADPKHAAAGRLPAALRRMCGVVQKGAPAPRERKIITIDPRTQPTVPELLLEDVLKEMAKTRGEEFAKIAAEIRKRFSARVKPYRKDVPIGLRLGGGVVVVPKSGCAPQPAKPTKPAETAKPVKTDEPARTGQSGE